MLDLVVPSLNTAVDHHVFIDLDWVRHNGTVYMTYSLQDLKGGGGVVAAVIAVMLRYQMQRQRQERLLVAIDELPAVGLKNITDGHGPLLYPLGGDLDSAEDSTMRRVNGGRGGGNPGRAAYLSTQAMEALPYNVTSYDNKLGGAIFPFLEQTRRAWRILTWPVNETIEPHLAHTFGLDRPTLPWAIPNGAAVTYAAAWLGMIEAENALPWLQGLSPAQITIQGLRELGLLADIIQTKEGLVVYPTGMDATAGGD